MCECEKEIESLKHLIQKSKKYQRANKILINDLYKENIVKKPFDLGPVFSTRNHKLIP